MTAQSNGLTEPSVIIIKVLVRYKDLRKSLALAINYVQAARAASSQVLKYSSKKENVIDFRILIIYQMSVYLPRKNVPGQKNPKKMISRFYLITN
jgi:hypothetical protein